MSADGPAAGDAGTVIGGQYRLLEEVGRGAFGTVHRSVHVVDGREFAVKLLRPDLLRDAEARRRFLREAAAVARLAHPGVAQIRHYGEEDGAVFLVMDLCPGETLQALLAREGALDPARAAEIASRVLDTLAAAHAAGIVHRDLKPSNVVVQSADGRLESVRVVDFGLALVVSDERARLARREGPVDASRVGTVGYMSPEQVRGDEVVDGRSDLFSVGAMLHEMVSGRPPFASEAPFSTMLRILDAPPEPLPPLAAGPLAPVIRRALEKDPDARWPDAAAFAQALRSAASPATTRAEASSRRSRRLRTPVLLVVAAAAVALAAVVAWPAIETHRARTAAADAFREGRYADVVAALSPLLARGVADGEDHLLAGRARTELIDPDAAGDLEAARRALGHVPRVALARARWLWFGASDFEGALEALGAAVSDGVVRPEALRERAMMVAVGVRAVDLPVERSRLAERDVEVLAARDPRDPWVPFLRALERFARADRGALPLSALDDVMADLERARALGLRTSSVDYLAFDVHHARARAARAAGEPEQARAHAREGEKALGAAIESAARDPGERPRLRTPARLRAERGSLRLFLGDRAGAVEDFRAATGPEPRTAARTSELAFGLRHAGRFEEALALYEQLLPGLTVSMIAKDAAWCRLRISQTRAAAGDLDGARREAAAATRLYEDALAFPNRSATLREGPEPVTLAYLAEARVWESRLAAHASDADADAERREAALLAAAAEALAKAESVPPDNSSVVREVAFRRAEHAAVVGDVDASLAALARGMLDRKDLEPEWYERRGFGRLGLAARTRLAGDFDVARRHAAEARADFVLAGRIRPVPFAVDAYGRALCAWIVAAGEGAGAALAILRDAAGASDATEPEPRLAALRCRRLAAHLAIPSAEASSLDAALVADLAAGRWYGSRDYVAALARVLEGRVASDGRDGSDLDAVRATDVWLAR